MHQFKEGDRVVIHRPENWIGSSHPTWVSNMHKYDGATHTLKMKSPNRSYMGWYTVDGNGWVFSEDWMTLIEPASIENERAQVGDTIKGVGLRSYTFEGEEVVVTASGENAVHFENPGRTMECNYLHSQYTIVKRAKDPLAKSYEEVLEEDVKSYREGMLEYETKLKQETKFQIRENKNMEESTTKYYKLSQDLPTVEKGAIVNGTTRKPISSLWNLNEEDDPVIPTSYFSNKKWFERVYLVEVDGQTKFVDKKTAKKLLEESVTLVTKK